MLKLFFDSLKNTLSVEIFFIFGNIINTFAFAGLDRGCCVVDPHEKNAGTLIVSLPIFTAVEQASCCDTPKILPVPLRKQENYANYINFQCQCLISYLLHVFSL